MADDSAVKAARLGDKERAYAFGYEKSDTQEQWNAVLNAHKLVRFELSGFTCSCGEHIHGEIFPHQLDRFARERVLAEAKWCFNEYGFPYHTSEEHRQHRKELEAQRIKQI